MEKSQPKGTLKEPVQLAMGCTHPAERGTEGNSLSVPAGYVVRAG